MKRKTRPLAALLTLGAGLALSMPGYAADPQLTIQQEVAAHPDLAKGIRDCEHLLDKLESDHGNYGGDNLRAQGDLQKAIHSLRRALLWRLHLDDAAIDAANI